MAEFARYFSQKLSRPHCVDVGVYKTFQCVRMLGSTKLGDNRHSRVLNMVEPTAEERADQFRRSMIGYKPEISYIVADPILEPVQPVKQRAEVHNEIIAYILEHAADHYIGYEYRNTNGNRIYFNRSGVQTPCCDICNRVHDNDNALFMTLHASKVTRGCLRDGTKTHVDVLDLPADMTVAVEPAAETTRLTSAERLKKLVEMPAKENKLLLEAYNENLEMVCYDEPKMRPYPGEDVPTIIIQAQKGVGKTENLVKLIREEYAGKTIIALSHRETFTTKLVADLPGFVSYQDINGSIDPLVHNRVVVQVESLCRITLEELLNVGAGVDLVIMDESESIIDQLSSGLDRHFNESWDIFNYLTLYARQVIAMDANISNRTIMALADRAKKSKCVYVKNTFQRAAETSIELTCDEKQWRASLFKDLDAGLHVFIPCNSATEAKALKIAIEGRYPGKDIQLYTGDSDQAVKRADIANISSAWSCEVLIFTPTIRLVQAQ
eukprot:TRINITY_DN905_c0_g1_i2.p1 TRINITY_DN905_c0_g1~~TRINITY_DN905_c0_g1_i2.p1  ORF type:complete len:495 (+),score=58.69 TRINITY_DN905_c0_g1_i2:531-2015(+)